MAIDCRKLLDRFTELFGATAWHCYGDRDCGGRGAIYVHEANDGIEQLVCQWLTIAKLRDWQTASDELMKAMETYDPIHEFIVVFAWNENGEFCIEPCLITGVTRDPLMEVIGKQGVVMRASTTRDLLAVEWKV